MAAVFCASLSRSAIRFRSRVILTRSSRPDAGGRLERVAAGGDRRAPPAARRRRAPCRPGRSIDVALGDVALGAGGRDLGEVDALLGRELARGRAGLSGTVAAGCPLGLRHRARRRAGRRRAGRCPRASACSLASCLGRRGRRPCRRPSSIRPITAPTATSVPTSTRISDSTPAEGAGTSRLTLSVSSSTIGSSTPTGIAGLLQPLGDGGLGHRLAEGRHADLDAHLLLPDRSAGAPANSRS